MDGVPQCRHIRKVHTRNCSPTKKSKFFKQGVKLDSHVITGKLLVFIRNDDYQISLSLSATLYVLGFNLRVAYHSNRCSNNIGTHKYNHQFLSASLIRHYMLIPYINCSIFIKGIITNIVDCSDSCIYVCMYINVVLIYIYCV